MGKTVVYFNPWRMTRHLVRPSSAAKRTVGLKMTDNKHHFTTRHLVRSGYSQESTWREALGPMEPLLVFSDELGSIDAPERLPSGGMRSCNLGGPVDPGVYRG